MHIDQTYLVHLKSGVQAKPRGESASCLTTYVRKYPTPLSWQQIRRFDYCHSQSQYPTYTPPPPH